MKKIIIMILMLSILCGPAFAGISDNLEMTQDERNRSEARRCADYRHGAMETLQSSTKTGFRAIWYNPRLSPADHFSILGPNGGSLFSDFEKLQQLLIQLNPDWKLLIPPYEYSIADDGVVTIGAKLDPDPNKEVV